MKVAAPDRVNPRIAQDSTMREHRISLKKAVLKVYFFMTLRTVFYKGGNL